MPVPDSMIPPTPPVTLGDTLTPVQVVMRVLRHLDRQMEVATLAGAGTVQ